MPDLSHSGPVSCARVLVVEDETLVAVCLQDALECLGYDCCAVAGDPVTAIAAAEEHRPTVALVDIGLGGNGDGVMLACQLQEQFGIAVILVSGATDPGLLNRVAELRPSGFLSKPYTDHDLARALQLAVQALPS